MNRICTPSSSPSTSDLLKCLTQLSYAGSVDPLLEGGGSYSDDSGGTRRTGGAASGGHAMSARSSRQDLDAQSVARSYNETIIRPAQRPLHTPSGAASYRSSRSHAGTSDVSPSLHPIAAGITSTLFLLQDGRTMAERDGGSSFVLSPSSNQLYRIHVGDI